MFFHYFNNRNSKKNFTVAYLLQITEENQFVRDFHNVAICLFLKTALLEKFVHYDLIGRELKRMKYFYIYFFLRRN